MTLGANELRTVRLSNIDATRMASIANDNSHATETIIFATP